MKDCSFAVEKSMLEILPEEDDTFLRRLMDSMRYSLLSGGKRIRAFLVIASSDLFFVPRSVSIRFACAIEMIHSYSLIHDDLPALDDDDVRRGIPSNHKKFGEGTAILAGDGLLTKAFEIISGEDLDLSPTSQLKAINIIAKAIGNKGLIGGQIFDLNYEDYPMELEDVLLMQKMKTGALFGVCCEIGGTLGSSVSTKMQHHISMYAKSLGSAFQMIDDLSDYKSDGEKREKSSQKHRNLTVVNKIGIEKTKDEIKILIDQAVSMLGIFEHDRASVLVEFARYLGSKVNDI